MPAPSVACGGTPAGTSRSLSARPTLAADGHRADGLIHLLAAATAVLYLVTGQLGINPGYYRRLAHRSIGTPRALERGLALCGTLASQIGPISRVGNHFYP